MNHVALLNLTGLQKRLDALAEGQSLTLSVSDYRRLFGVNADGASRAQHFAQGHRCVLEVTPSAITFRKTA